MRPPLSYMPLLPAAIIVIAVTLIINPAGKRYPDDIHVAGQWAIVESNIIDNSGQRLIVSLDIPGHGDVKSRLTVPATYSEFQIGDSVIFSCKLRKPTPRTARENDYTGALKVRGIIYTGFVPPDSIAVTGIADNLYWRIRRLRPLAGDLLKASSLSSQACEFLNATITGDTSILSDDTRQLFSSVGLAHVLALSGLHVGILVVVISIALFPLYLFRMRRTQLLLTILLLWSYAVFTGLSPSVTRAVIMATAVSGGIILQRRYFGINGLLLALCVIVIASPLQLYQPGFQMSFLSAASILAVIPLINRINRKRPVLFYLASMVCVSIAATVGTGIVSAYYFHTFPLYFLIANIPVLLLLPILTGCGILLILFESLGIDPTWLCSAIDFLYGIIQHIAHLIATLPGATIDRLYFPGWVMLPYFLTIVSLIAAIYLHRRYIKIACAACAALTLLCFHLSQPASAEEEIFLTRDTYSTTCLYRHNDTVYMLTTAKAANARSLIEIYHRTYSDYLGRHGVDSIMLAADTASFGSITRNGCITVIGGRRYLVVTDDKLPPTAGIPHLDCAVICRGFRGNVIDISSTYKPDSVLLSNDLHPRRHDRYADSLTFHKIPFRSLKQQ